MRFSLNRASQARRDAAARRYIPYTAHVSPYVIATKQGEFIQTFRLRGMSFTTADDTEINAWHERANILWRNISSPHVALWTHIVRRQDCAYPQGRFPSEFARELDAMYRDRIEREHLMHNELYCSLIYRPTAGASVNLAAKFLSRAQPHSDAATLADALDACEKLSDTLLAALEPYEPERLGIYRVGLQYRSRVLEFLAQLINAEWQPFALPRAHLDEVLAISRPLIGYEVIEYRTPTHTRLGAMLAIKEYATPTPPGVLNALLSAPFEFILTQSFTFLSKATSEGLMTRQYNRLCNSGDFAHSQAEELKAALDALASGEFALGDHHFSLQVLTQPVAGVSDGHTVEQLKALNDRVGLARSLLTDTGFAVAREDLALEAAYWAQLPGQFSLRPRKAPVTSRNFAALSPFHNYPAGRPHGNHWGDATAVLVTEGSPYYFSLHAGDPRVADGGRRDVGHTLICGPTGSGKTVFIGFLIAMLTRQGVTQVVFDRDRGLEILVRALGGQYLALKNGRPTGCNPLQLPLDPANREFLRGWLSVLGRPPTGGALSVSEEADLDQALRGTLALDPPARRLSRLIEFLDPTDAEGLYARLARWAYATQGEYAWVFDNPQDAIVPLLGSAATVGFDVTDFLANPTTRVPLTQYLLHLITRMLDGRRLVCWMDEFSQLLDDPIFEQFSKVGVQTWRKLDGVFCAATSSPHDVIRSPISRALIEQVATEIHFPNANATAEIYRDGLGLSARELALIKNVLLPGSRRFLVKQSRASVICELDLQGLTRALAVISGRRSSVDLLEKLIAEHGDAPENWLAPFYLALDAPPLTTSRGGEL